MKTVLRKRWVYAPFALIILSFLACAEEGRMQEVTPGVKGNMEVSMTVSSFHFDPSVIQVGRTGDFIIHAHNVADSDHNLTVKEPQGRVIATVDLPAGETVSLKVDLKVPGTYEFYCDKPMHAAFGMKGEIKVAPGPQ
jgi:plastocyanin